MHKGTKETHTKEDSTEKAPATQHNKNQGAGKRAAEAEEDSEEESDHRPHRKCMKTTVEPSDDEEPKSSGEPEVEPEVLHGKQEDRHELGSDFEV